MSRVMWTRSPSLASVALGYWASDFLHREGCLTKPHMRDIALVGDRIFGELVGLWCRICRTDSEAVEAMRRNRAKRQKMQRRGCLRELGWVNLMSEMEGLDSHESTRA